MLVQPNAGLSMKVNTMFPKLTSNSVPSLKSGFEPPKTKTSKAIPPNAGLALGPSRSIYYQVACVLECLPLSDSALYTVGVLVAETFREAPHLRRALYLPETVVTHNRPGDKK